MVGSASKNDKSSNLENDLSKEEKVQSPSRSKDTSKPDDHCEDPIHKVDKIQNENRPPLKKKRIASFSNGGSSLMKQVWLYFLNEMGFE